jgi:hypothetical protein
MNLDPEVPDMEMYVKSHWFRGFCVSSTFEKCTHHLMLYFPMDIGCGTQMRIVIQGGILMLHIAHSTSVAFLLNAVYDIDVTTYLLESPYPIDWPDTEF